MTAQYHITDFPFGHVLAVYDEGRLTYITLGASKRAVMACLPEGAVGAPKALGPVMTAVDACLRGLPFAKPDFSRFGTAFQRRVWQELCRIPHGTTRSYAQIARAIGKPRAVRAVANACGANPFALLVPCHRVIASDGGLGGYSGGGVGVKRKLLDYERACSSGARRLRASA